ncbi:Abnormal spindle-like microcephaly-associated protein [Phytophthora cactorum]|nr:Abnormal spindle-like microcephaly-associated protein [Phytophthora cactorum]
MYATPSMFRTPSLSSNARSAGISCGTDFMVRKSSDMRGVNDASRAHSKWASRASFDPFNSAQSDASDAQNCHETTALLSDQDSDGKENRVPPIGRNWGHPNVTMRRGSRYSLLEAELLPSTPNFERSTASSLLGKRPATNKSLNASTETKEDDSDAERAQRNPLAAANAVTHFEARALALHAESLGLEVENIGTGSATMLVDDFSHIGQLRFGAVHWYEGYAMNRSGEESAHKKTRFKCDLHVCVVDALKSVTLRVTFDPLPTDVGKEVTAMLKFTVNDSVHTQNEREPEQEPVGSPSKRSFAGSWWKQRQEVYDDNWMAKQTQGFTKWINYVLLDGTAQRLGGHDAQDNDEGQTIGVKRRFDFSSLRVLAQKRMESKWAQAAVDLYHSPSMDDILFNLQDEIGNKGLLFRADRPVYADVGLQEDLISLLNNYHPVWLCLGLYAVLGNQVMRQEKCSLRAIFRTTARVLRRIILKHLVKDSHVAQNYRLVKNLMTPMDGSTADRNDGGNAFTNTKKNINGREYFDSLTQSFMLKFFMLTLSGERRSHRQAPEASGIPLKHEQTPLDEIDLEVKNLETDLRDGVRLAKLMEALTTAPVPAQQSRTERLYLTKGLSTFLRVPALSRLQKVHNVEICLHFLRDKCGASVLDNLKSRQQQRRQEEWSCACVFVWICWLKEQSGREDGGKSSQGHVNGHREKTLALLWKLISCFQLQSLVDAQTMRREIDNVAKRMSFSAKDFFDNQQQSEPLIHTDEHECYTLLLEWCRAVCANYNVAQLGEVPVLMPQQYNTKNPPEDKMVVTFVCYLQSRLMDSYSEIHAASRLKRWWKSPLIRLKMHRKKPQCSRCAAVLVHFQSQATGYPSVPQLLGAAHLVKSTVRTWIARRHFVRLRRAAVAIQRAFRTHRQLRSNGDSLGAVLVVQYHWRKRLRWRREKERQKQKAMRHKVAQRVRVRASCAVIERNWLQYLSREGARLLRQQMITDRHVAATRIQVAWRRGRCRVVARKQRQQMWRRMNRSAGTIQRTWSAFRRCREETQRVLALQRFELMMKEKEIQKRQLKLKNKVETRAVKCVQKCFRKFTLRKREVAATKLASAFRGKKQKLKFQKEKHAALVLQRNVRMWRRRRQLSALTQFHDMLKSYQRMKATEAQRRVMRLQELKHMVETRAAYRIQTLFRRYRFQKRTLAAVTIQSLVRAWTVKNWYSTLCRSACLLQRNLRIWRRQTQLRGLLSFQKMLLRYRRMQREEEEQQEHIRQHRLRRLQESVEHRAANRIQSVYRVYAYHKRMLAATRIQAAFRGFMKRQQYAKTYASVVLIQRAVRSWLVVTRFRRALRLHRAAVSIQKLARGWSSRRLRLNFYTLQTQLQRLRVLMSCWQIEFCAGLLRKRIADANRIATSWRAFCLRSVINKRIQHKRRMDAAAQRMQVWWLGLCCKWAERQRRAEEKRQREMETMALAMAKARAERIVGSWLRAKVIIPFRERNFHFVAVRRLQAWWRGTLVRLHHSTPEITQQRKKLSTMKLVGQQTYASSATSATSLQPLRVKAHEDRRVQTEQPQTLGARLDMALHMLLHVYRRSADKSRSKRVVATDDKDRLDVDLRALDTLVDLLHIHRDMHHVFVLSADVITYYLELLKPLVDRNAGVQESWSEAEKRLSCLKELLSRKLALYNATASFRRVNQIPEKPHVTNLMRKMNPKTAVSIMEKLTVLLER